MCAPIKRNEIITDINTLDPELFEGLDGLVDIFSDKIGIINALMERYELKKYNLFMFQNLNTKTSELFDIKKESELKGGLGVGSNKKGALLAAFGEAVERYCMSCVCDPDIWYGRWELLPKKERISEFDLYTNDFYKSTNIFSHPKTDNIHWVKMRELEKNDCIYWPASLVYIPYNLEPKVSETSSTGVASHINIDKAIENGVLEVIERDALMINFHKRLNPPKLILNKELISDVPLLKMIMDDFSVVLYKLYTDIDVPTYLGYIWNQRDNNFRFGIGAASGLSAKKTIDKVLRECLFTHFYVENLINDRKDSPKEICRLYEHFLYYQDKSLFNEMQFDGKDIMYKNEETTFDKVLVSIKNCGYKIFWKELTTSDVRSTNFKVVKTIIPGFIDLNTSYKYRRENAQRYEKLPKKINVKPGCVGLSTLPHPMP